MSNSSTVQAEKKQQAPPWFWWASWVCVLGGIIVMGFLIIYQIDERLSLYNQILELRVQQDDALEELESLKIERGSERSYERVVDIAVNELHMQFPDKVEVTSSETIE
ncbi:MAG: hypothetical protein F4227_05190 [Gammaproteobacteria bacterium]|nr:hypothetical protein [Gammaproteobacteria bacterium]MYF02361.1 hypothetical protein [Gammaproteobacteria bacterium]MYI78272.1 hypothetical protein [Gammaproteobacteria bacterium]